MSWRGNGNKAFYAQGRLKPGTMNKGEAAYAGHLELLKRAGEILWYRFEGLKLRLADNTFYTPDFAVMTAECVIECHEVKGFWQDDARAKIKIAADLYPFRFKALKARAKKHGGGWEEEDFSRSTEAAVPDMFHVAPPRTYADVSLPAEPF
jgi:hypothetical protein